MTEDDSASWLRRELIAILSEETEALADVLCERIRQRMGGREVYIPAPDKADRDAQIRAMFNGRNLREVMREFGVSRAVVYRAIK